MPERVLADTSFMFAVFDRHDAKHDIAQATYRLIADQIALPAVILPELGYHLERASGTVKVAEVVRVMRQGSMSIIELQGEDYDRAADILDKYHDTRIDLVDACIMALAERLKITRVLTFDRRDFGLYRPAHVEQFELLP